jgi:hypothetical protein
MWFEGKWVQLGDIMLSEVSQFLTDKGCVLSLICGGYIQKVNICTKTNFIIFKCLCTTCLQSWNSPMELRKGGKGKENDRGSTIL